MKLSFVILFCFVWIAELKAEINVVDDTGAEISLTSPARRIISLAPHATELLYAAGAGAWLVGAVEFSDYPPAAKDIPRIGKYNAFDLEAIVALEPDLIVAWRSGNPSQVIDKLKSLGIAVYVSEPQSVGLIPSNIERLGQLTGQAAQAKQVAMAFRQQWAQLKKAHAQVAKVSVFFQLWHQPIITVNGEQMISDLISLCGGENVFSQLHGLAPQVSVEAVLAANPQVMLLGAKADDAQQWINAWQRWPQLQAVANNHLISLNPDLFHRQGPRILQAAKILCQHLDLARVGR